MSTDLHVLFLQLDCLFWPAAQAINFYLVPATFRVLYLNVLYVVWSMVLSYLKHHVSTDGGSDCTSEHRLLYTSPPGLQKCRLLDS